MITRSRALSVVVAFLLALTTLAPIAARADAASSTTDAVDYIAATWEQNPTTEPGLLVDNIVALASARQHPQVLAEMVEALRSDTGLSYAQQSSGAMAKVMLAATSVGEDARTFFGSDHDMVAELNQLIEDQPPSAVAAFNPFLIAIELTRLAEPVPTEVLDYLFTSQTDGGWGYSFGGTTTIDPDFTALGISTMYLLSTAEHVDQATRERASQALNNAIGWADDEANQQQDAAGNYYWTTYSPANTTGLMAAALAEAGVEVDAPRRFLMAQQELTEVGAFAARLDQTVPDLRATVQAVLGLTGSGYATALFDITTDAEPEPWTITAYSAGSKTVGALTNAWGTLTGAPAGTAVSTQVKLPSGAWSTSQRSTINASGFYTIALTYGANTPGTYTFRVVASGEQNVISQEFTLTRLAPTVTASSAGSKRVGELTYTWGTVPGVPAGTRVETQVRLSNGTWSTSQRSSTNANGYYTIPLTYGADTPGTYTFRVHVVDFGPQAVSSPVTLTRIAANHITTATAGTKTVNTPTFVWGSVTGVPAGTRVVVQAEVNGQWSNSRSATTSETGYYQVQLTYGSDTPGTYRYRVVAAGPNGYVVSEPFTLTRTR